MSDYKMFTIIREIPNYAYLAGKTVYENCRDMDGLKLEEIRDSGFELLGKFTEIIDNAPGVPEKHIRYRIRKNNPPALKSKISALDVIGRPPRVDTGTISKKSSGIGCISWGIIVLIILVIVIAVFDCANGCM